MECGRIEFKGTVGQLAELVEIRMKGVHQRVQWGKDAIVTALGRMMSMSVSHRKWVLRGTGENAQPEALNLRRRMRSQMLVVENGSLLVLHYGALNEDHEDLRVFRMVLASYCSRTTQPREILLAIDNPRFPWIYQSARMVRRTRHLVLRTPQ